MPEFRENKVSCGDYRSEMEITLEIVSGKWKAMLLWNLHLHQVVRYNEFRRLLPAITQKMLTQQLKDLEKYGIISRTVYHSVPPMVEYRLTQRGQELVPILDAMQQWGTKYVKEYSALRDEQAKQQ